MILSSFSQGQSLEDKQFELIFSIKKIKTGDTASELIKKLEPPWASLKTNKFIWDPQFAAWLPWTNTTRIHEWQSEPKDTGPHPWVIFALFTSPEKTNLIDALLYNGTPGVTPLVDGPYYRTLLSVKVGDNMRAVFKDLGRIDCKYFESNDGRWHVKALYYGYKGEMINIEADAGSGSVIRVWDGAL